MLFEKLNFTEILIIAYNKSEAFLATHIWCFYSYIYSYQISISCHSISSVSYLGYVCLMNLIATN